MIGSLKFKVTCLALVSIVATSFAPRFAYASCVEFLDQIETVSTGISYKTDPNTGKIRAILMVGESGFLAPKSSLVRKAKKKAFMRAKAGFVLFMKEKFVASDLLSDLTNESSTTDQESNTSSTIEEISALVETMDSSGASVLSGIVVLGECVDIEQKKVMVQAGWKAELSAAAADAKQTIKKEVARSDKSVTTTGGVSGSSSSNSSTSKAAGVTGYSKRSKIADDF
jgi:hypothetical protein